MLGRIWALLRDAVEGFVADDALTRGAGIAYFALFSLGPLLFIATGIAKMFFGAEAVDDAIAAQLTSLLGEQSAGVIRDAADKALGDATGGLALAIGIGTLLLTASGAFGALQSALNAVWKTEAPAADTTAETISRFVRAKAAAMGLVATTGFLLIVSLAVSAAISGLEGWIESAMPGLEIVVKVANILISLAILTALFAAIYKVLPDRTLAWRDVFAGAFFTAALFTIGKSAIAFYIGQSNVAGGFGAAGTIVVVLVWLYYSALIFLLGAEFTRAFANREGSRQHKPIPAKPAPALPQPPQVVRVPVAQPNPLLTLAVSVALIGVVRHVTRRAPAPLRTA
ncbi:MAG: YihY/virulence factor BrkB family protein, partial [Acetobacteraceae bacterium]|nr:YihY/virulence factor BrkB family protein [Acetobacteraceae bacterium]